jgi:hypothetical protein
MQTRVAEPTRVKPPHAAVPFHNSNFMKEFTTPTSRLLLRSPECGQQKLYTNTSVLTATVDGELHYSYSETCLCWPPLVPFTAAQLTPLANLWKPNGTTKLKLCNYHFCKRRVQSAETGGPNVQFRVQRQVVQTYSSECRDRSSKSRVQSAETGGPNVEFRVQIQMVQT